MKNINPGTLPNFHGLIIEDSNTFLFEFEVICKTYNYLLDAQKLKVFPSTLKDSTLRWFMILEGNNVESWERMKQTFIKKHKDYYNARNTRDDIFRMIQGENELLEDYEERLQLSYKRTHSCTPVEESLKLILLR